MEFAIYRDDLPELDPDCWYHITAYFDAGEAGPTKIIVEKCG